MYGEPKPLPGLRYYFHQDRNGSAPGSFWPLWGGWITADHVVKEMRGTIPAFVGSGWKRGGPAIDASISKSCKKPFKKPREPVNGESVVIWGIPGGSITPTYRTGAILIKRSISASGGYSSPTWIVNISEPPLVLRPESPQVEWAFPVVVGMSGGCVLDKQGNPLGVLVTRGSAWDDDKDGLMNQTCDFVSLSDVYDVFFGSSSIV